MRLLLGVMSLSWSMPAPGHHCATWCWCLLAERAVGAQRLNILSINKYLTPA
jgi:hypothetical protein